MRPARSPQDRDFGDDQAAYIGDDRDIRRWTEEPPLRDQRDLDAPDSFGSRHPSSWNALFADGSVHSLSYTLDAEIHRAQGNRHDGGR
jgi:prepilin-type processing-associated H-X9-DG protein